MSGLTARLGQCLSMPPTSTDLARCLADENGVSSEEWDVLCRRAANEMIEVASVVEEDPDYPLKIQRLMDDNKSDLIRFRQLLGARETYLATMPKNCRRTIYADRFITMANEVMIISGSDLYRDHRYLSGTVWNTGFVGAMFGNFLTQIPDYMAAGAAGLVGGLVLVIGSGMVDVETKSHFDHIRSTLAPYPSPMILYSRHPIPN